MTQIDWWNEIDKRVEDNEDIVYSLQSLQKSFKVTKLDCPHDAWFILDDSQDHWFKFAVVEFFTEECREDAPTLVKLLFHGMGPSSSLRECRHTYWGEDGYVFYPNADTIIAALKHLKTYYDMD